MANTNAPFGLRPVIGTYGTIRVRPYYLPSTYATATYIGDPVTLTGTSNTAQAFGFPIGTLPEVNVATAGTTNKVVGAIVGFIALPSDLTKQYNPASTERICYVADDPNQEFEIQRNVTVAASAADVGSDCQLASGSGSIYTGLSGWVADSNTITQSAAAQLKILGFSPRIDNDATATYAIMRVRLNLHFYANALAGV